MNVTFPSFATSYLPTPLTSLTVLPSSNVAGTSSSIGTSGFPDLNVGFPVCTSPLAPSDFAPSAVGVTGVTVGVYVAVAGVPFLSTRFTVTAGASPVNDFSGVNVTFPSFATSYLPTPLTSLTVLPSSNVAGTSLSIGTSGFPGVNLGVPVCTFP